MPEAAVIAWLVFGRDRRCYPRALETTHGSVYADYTRRVGRFGPGVGQKG